LAFNKNFAQIKYAKLARSHASAVASKRIQIGSQTARFQPTLILVCPALICGFMGPTNSMKACPARGPRLKGASVSSPDKQRRGGLGEAFHQSPNVAPEMYDTHDLPASQGSKDPSVA